MSTTTASPEGSSLSSDPLTPGERSFVDGVIDDLAGLIPRAVEQSDAGGLGMKFEPPEGWKYVLVNEGFDELMSALERAHRKGYMPDAIVEEYEGFDYRVELHAPQPEAKPATDVAEATRPG